MWISATKYDLFFLMHVWFPQMNNGFPIFDFLTSTNADIVLLVLLLYVYGVFDNIWMLCFPATTLTGFHFAVTALVGLVSNAAGYSASKDVPLWELLWFSVVANMSITGMNLSLMLNSVGFYQAWTLSLSSS